MAIPTDPEGKNALAKIVGRRLKAARKAAAMSQATAAAELNHKGITQVSLAEEGDRLPPLLDMLKYADLYAVPLDFLLGRIDDPIAEACEQGQGVVVRAVQGSISDLFSRFSSAVAEHVSVSVLNMRLDRSDLVEMIQVTAEMDRAIKRMMELNPEFEELRGSATVESAIMRFQAIGKRVEVRTRDERRQYDMIDRALDLEKIKGSFEQFRLSFDYAPTPTKPAQQDAQLA